MNRLRKNLLYPLLALIGTLAPFSQAQGIFNTFFSGEGMIIQVPLDTASVFNGSFPIDSAGYVHFPVLGREFVHGKSVAEVEEYLQKNAAPYLKDVHVSATPAIRVTLLGFWKNPGMYYIDAEATVWEAFRVAGGPAGEVNIHKWRVMRGSTDLSVPILDEFSKGSTMRAAGVKSGDIFVIPVPNPASGFWYWFRETLSVTAEVAAVTATILTTYLTIEYLQNR